MTEISTSVDNIWEHPGRVRLLTAQGQMGRTVRFDPRGQGASDHLNLEDVGRLDLWRDDALAVLDAVGFREVVVSAEGYASQAALLLAAAVPERISRMVLLNPYARLTRADDYPLGAELDVAGLVDYVRHVWGTGEITRGLPTLGSGAPDRNFPGRNERMGASPAVAAALVEACHRSDVRGVLPQITSPTLVAYTGDLPFGSPEVSRYVADHIVGARFIQSPSQTFYWGDSGVSDYAQFVMGGGAGGEQQAVRSVVFTDIVDSTGTAASIGDAVWKERLGYLDEFVAIEAGRWGGEVLKHTGDGHLIAFSEPSCAVAAGIGLLRASPTLDLALRVGIHSGEVQVRSDGDIVGMTVNIAARVMSKASPQQLLVSQTVADLLDDGAFQMTYGDTCELKGVPGTWTLYEVSID